MIEVDQNEVIRFNAHPIVKSAFRRICKTLMLDSNPYNWIREEDILYNRCYIWRSINKFDPGMTVFNWEKTKLGKRLESGGNVPISECESTVRKLRYVIIHYF